MSAVVKILFDICLLRKGPEDLPADNTLMFLLVLMSFVVSVFLSSFIHEYQAAMTLSAVGILVAFIFVKLLLVKRPERFVQTFSAILGVTILIDIISVPVIFPLIDEKLNENLVMLFSLLALAVYVWYVVVNGSIISRAISSTLGYGISIAIAYALVSYMLFEILLATFK